MSPVFEKYFNQFNSINSVAWEKKKKTNSSELNRHGNIV
jgi:hypothetical protein